MSQATMIVTPPCSPSPAVTTSQVRLFGTCAELPALTEMTVMTSEPLYGEIHTPTAIVGIPPGKFSTLCKHLNGTKQTKVTLTYHQEGNLTVITKFKSETQSILLPQIRADVAALSEQVTGVSEVLKRDLTGNVLHELRALNAKTSELLTLVKERTTPSGSYTDELKSKKVS